MTMVTIALVGVAALSGLAMAGAFVAGMQHRASEWRAVAFAAFVAAMIGALALALDRLATNNPGFKFQMPALCLVATVATVVVVRKLYAATWAAAAFLTALPVVSVAGLAWLFLHNLRITF